VKKLKLKALELGAHEILTRTQLKTILGGGFGSGSCDMIDPRCPEINAEAGICLDGLCNYGGITGGGSGLGSGSGPIPTDQCPPGEGNCGTCGCKPAGECTSGCT